MDAKNCELCNCIKRCWTPENTVEIEQEHLLSITEKICGQCRYPLLALRLLIYVICKIDADGKICLNARRLAKTFDVHYDTLTKCIKYLRENEIIGKEK